MACDSGAALAADAMAELSHEVAGLPSELDPENEGAKRFDLLSLTLQITLLRSQPGFERLRDRVKEIAGLLEEKDATKSYWALVHPNLEKPDFHDPGCFAAHLP